ncbi:MAG: hypothetical protein ONB55_22470 [candidate division KSB1 bacterium]|nr:hypothetical protein [candidate division KSB1 bacterium]
MPSRKTPQTKADPAIAALSGEDRVELARMCEAHSNVSEIHRWLCDRVPGIPYRSVLAWYNREYPPGENARFLNALLAEFRGINPVDAHAASLAQVVKLTDLIMSEVNESGLVDLSPSLLSNLVDLLREQRQSAQSLANSQRIKDTKALELAGGYRAVEIAVRMSEGTPHAGTVNEVMAGAIAQLEQEVG